MKTPVTPMPEPNFRAASVKNLIPNGISVKSAPLGAIYMEKSPKRPEGMSPWFDRISDFGYNLLTFTLPNGAKEE